MHDVFDPKESFPSSLKCFKVALITEARMKKFTFLPRFEDMTFYVRLIIDEKYFNRFELVFLLFAEIDVAFPVVIRAMDFPVELSLHALREVLGDVDDEKKTSSTAAAPILERCREMTLDGVVAEVSFKALGIVKTVAKHVANYVGAAHLVDNVADDCRQCVDS